MKTKGRKYIALFLIFSLVMLSANLYAKERRGAKLIITKKDGTQFQGELITVKQNSLLILVPEGKDVSFDISDILSIRVVKKSKFWTGAFIGCLIGTVFAATNPRWHSEYWGATLAISIFGGLGAYLGAGIGLIAGIDKKIQIEGMTESEIQRTLDKLRKKARIRDYK